MHLSRRPLVLFAVLVIAILVAVFSWQAMILRQRSEYHEYRYDVSISASSLLENCTLLLPVPSAGNRSALGEALVRGEGYSVPPGWNVTIGQVKEIPVLEIFAPAIIPEYHGYPIRVEPGNTPVETPPPPATEYSDVTPVLMPLHFGVSLKAPEPIDTRNPFGREPLLADKGAYSPESCQWPGEPGQCYRFPAPVSFSCSSGGEGNVTLFISGGGTNQWWMGGWSGNSYGETIEVTVEDPRQGWVRGQGFLRTGSGVY